MVRFMTCIPRNANIALVKPPILMALNVWSVNRVLLMILTSIYANYAQEVKPSIGDIELVNAHKKHFGVIMNALVAIYPNITIAQQNHAKTARIS